MSRIQALYVLQQIDSNIDAHNANLARIEVTLADNSMLENARQVLLQAESVLKKDRSVLRDLEFESENCAKHVKDLETKLYGGLIKGVKDMELAQQEIETFKNRRKDLDDKSVEAMIAVEEADGNVRASRKKLEEAEVSWNSNCVSLKENRIRLQQELPTLQAERERQAAKLIAADLVFYEKLRLQKQGIAVTELIMTKFCGKCRVELPLNKQREVKIPGALVICPSCGRVLYLH